METCKNCLHYEICTFHITGNENEKCPHYTPTADVVPKSEVAREIFAEIEREIIAALRSNYRAKQERIENQIPDDFVWYMCEGKIAALRGIDDFIAELKKKYTEEGK